MAFIRDRHGELAQQLIAIDGKAIRPSLERFPSLLKADTTVRDTIRGKRLQAAFGKNKLTTFLKVNISSELALALFQG